MIINPISYPGNKTRIIKEIISEIDPNCSGIVDIFAGSGMVAVNSNYKQLYCNDISQEAIEMLKYFYCETSEKILENAEQNIKK